MNQRILLADNSYTIRRIVELSFQDIENVELFSFENGTGLKDKLLELLPQIVLIDIKLPEFNGYEACKFINNEPSLVNTKVLLMKGGFEPIDEYLLQGLKYEDIVTKPFDSKLLESQVIKLLKETESIAPPPPLSIPEELDVPSFSENLDVGISIETDIESDSFPDNLPDFNEGKEEAGISFSDINEEIDKEKVIPESNDILSDEENEMSFEDAVEEMETPEILSQNEMLNNGIVVDDEIEPSEEITQGAYEDQNDLLSSEQDEEFLNPFKDTSEVKPVTSSINTDEINLKEHIKEHEDDLGIDSLTMEEIKIKSEIENRRKSIDDDSDEFGTDTFGGLEKQPDFANISFDEEEKYDDAKPVEEKKIETKYVEPIDQSIFEAAEGILNDDIGILSEEEKITDEPALDMNISTTEDTVKSADLDKLFSAENNAAMIEDVSFKEEVKEVQEPVHTKNILEPEMFEQASDIIEEQIAEVETEIEEAEIKSIFEKEQNPVFADLDIPEFGEIKDEISFKAVNDKIDPEQFIGLEEKIEEPVIESKTVTVTEDKLDYPVIEPETIVSAEKPAYEEKIEEPELEKVEKEITETVVESKNTADPLDMDKVMERVEDKLTVAIKEILWEVIPHLAEKIIKKEISELKTEIDNKEL